MHVIVPEGFDDPGQPTGGSERLVLRAATGVVATSEWTRQQVLTRYAIPKLGLTYV